MKKKYCPFKRYTFLDLTSEKVSPRWSTYPLDRREWLPKDPSQPTSSSEARGLRDLSQPMTSSEARGLTILGKPKSSSESRGLSDTC